MNIRNNIDKMSKIKLLSIHNYDSDLVLTLKLKLYACLTFTRGHSPRDSEKNKSHHVVSRGEKSLYWYYMSNSGALEWFKTIKYFPWTNYTKKKITESTKFTKCLIRNNHRNKTDEDKLFHFPNLPFVCF